MGFSMNRISALIIALFSVLNCARDPVDFEKTIAFPSRADFPTDSSVVASILSKNGLDLTTIYDTINLSWYPSSYNYGFSITNDTTSHRITILCLVGLNLKQIPPEISLLDSLKFLYLSNNNIHDLPDEISLLHLHDSGLGIDDNEIAVNSISPVVEDWINRHTNKKWEVSQYINLTDSYQRDSAVVRHILDASGFSGLDVRTVTHVRNSRIVAFRWPYYFTERQTPNEVLHTNTKPIVYADSISKCDSLEVIDVCYCGLTEFPPDLYRLQALKKLWLAGNHIAKLDTRFCVFSDLSLLNLSGNDLIDLPECITDFTNLVDFGNRGENEGIFCGNNIKLTSQKVIDWLNHNWAWKECQDWYWEEVVRDSIK
jgi:Leucine-rich repeat (LRR) protein